MGNKIARTALILPLGLDQVVKITLYGEVGFTDKMKNHSNFLLNLKFFLSIIYYVLGLFANRKLSAIKFFEKSLKNHSSPKHAFLCYKEIGIVYYYNDLFQKAKYYLHRAETLNTKSELDVELLTFLGLVYYTEKNNVMARKYFEKALSKYGKFEWIKKDFIRSHLKAVEYKLRNPEMSP